MGQNVNTKVYAKGPMPTINNDGDAGIDLKYNGSESIEFQKGVVYKVPTGVFVEIPIGRCGIIFERSGNGVKYGIQIFGRIVDAPYRGEIFVICGTNFWATHDLSLDNQLPIPTKAFILNPGDKIAQMVITDCYPEIEKVVDISQLTQTVRGEKGLGSSDAAKS